MTGSPATARCPDCGAPLAISLRPDGSVTTADLTVTFRRHTDYVVCDRCLVSHRVAELRGRPVRTA
jgi:uncharacterized protein with PIN domain